MTSLSPHGSPKKIIRPSSDLPIAPCKKPRTSYDTINNRWNRLGLDGEELRLCFTLKTGQSFRWRLEEGEGEGHSCSSYRGVIRDMVIQCVQEEADVKWRVIGRRAGVVGDEKEDENVVRDYFNIDNKSLRRLRVEWSQRDKRFAAVAPFLPGARTLRQDPVECLFSFICSSNNHISRISSMVEKLCSTYGTPLEVMEGESLSLDFRFFAFPTLDQLKGATEEDLREMGFGYRAKFIVNSVSQLNSMPEGGKEWLMSLRSKPLPEVIASLSLLQGVGPKVASCVALFSIDKTNAIPVDTHVWSIACQHYTPHLRGKTLTPKLHPEIQAAFQAALGDHCGWAHNTLFINELKSFQKKLSDDYSSDKISN